MKTQVTSSVVVFMLLSLCIYTTGCRESKSRESENKTSFVRGYKVSSPAYLKISTAGGNITAIGRNNNSDSIKVSFIVARKGKVIDISLSELQRIADVEILNYKSVLEINIKKFYEKNISVGFLIITPNKTSANFITSGGNVSLDNVIGKQEIGTSGGNIYLRNISGNINANTSGGNIFLNNINGKTSISTSGGNIKASIIKPAIIASTSGGSINLNEISGSVKASTSGGNISADITQLTEKLELITSGGNISASIPARLGLDLDFSADKIEAPLINFTGYNKRSRIKGRMNGGGIPAIISTSGGNIAVTYK